MNTYYIPGARKIRGQRMTILDRIKRWRAKRKWMKLGICPWEK